MEFLRPATWAEALAAKAEHPDALPIAGGTDVMVEVNFGKTRPAALLDLSAIPGLATWSTDMVPGWIRIGAGMTYARIIEELGGLFPGLAMAARTVGSPQIRNRGTIGGNLGSASPAGDLHPPLLATPRLAEVWVESVREKAGPYPLIDFFTGPKKNILQPDELIKEVRIRVPYGPEQFAKIGTRNAMVIAVCSFALSLHPNDRAVGTGIGSAGPTPLWAAGAEDYLAGELDWDGRGPLDERVIQRFGELVAAAARPIDDVRGTAAYRRHALAVMARRTLARAWNEYRG